MLFLPLLFLAKALAVSLMKTVACMQKVFLLYIKTFHSFFTPLQNAHFRILCLLHSLALFPELSTCCSTITWFYLSSFFSVSNHGSVPDCSFFLFPPSSWSFLCLPQPTSSFPLLCKPRTQPHIFICPEKRLSSHVTEFSRAIGMYQPAHELNSWKVNAGFLFVEISASLTLWD